jgi:hypothetical protein
MNVQLRDLVAVRLAVEVWLRAIRGSPAPAAGGFSCNLFG